MSASYFHFRLRQLQKISHLVSAVIGRAFLVQLSRWASWVSSWQKPLLLHSIPMALNAEQFQVVNLFWNVPSSVAFISSPIFFPLFPVEMVEFSNSVWGGYYICRLSCIRQIHKLQYKEPCILSERWQMLAITRRLLPYRLITYRPPGVRAMGVWFRNLPLAARISFFCLIHLKLKRLTPQTLRLNNTIEPVFYLEIAAT